MSEKSPISGLTQAVYLLGAAAAHWHWQISNDAATGTVIYRSKMHAGLKRNLQVMPGAEWLDLLCKHIPDRHEHLVRYLGWYSNRARRTREGAITREDAPCSGGSGERVRHPRHSCRSPRSDCYPP